MNTVKVHVLWGDTVTSRQQTSQKKIATKTIDYLFSYEVACFVYKTFMKYDCCKLDKSSMSTLVFLDVFITSFVDLLPQSIKESRVLPKTSTGSKVPLYENKAVKSRMKNWNGQYKDGKFPQKSFDRLKNFQP